MPPLITKDDSGLGPEFAACMRLMGIATKEPGEPIQPLSHEEHKAIARELMRLFEMANMCTCGASQPEDA